MQTYAKQGFDDIYFVVNPAGAVHRLEKHQADDRLQDPLYRLATDEEIEKFQSRRSQGYQDPIATPFNPEQQQRGFSRARPADPKPVRELPDELKAPEEN